MRQDIDWALGAEGWSLDESSWKLRPSSADGRNPEVGQAKAMREAEAVVTALKRYMDKATECLQPPNNPWRPFQEWLSGGRLMSV